MATSLSNIWNRLNNQGEGFPLGEEDDSIADAIDREGYTFIGSEEAGTDQAVVLAERDGQCIIVADASGPWAVRMPAETTEEDVD